MKRGWMDSPIFNKKPFSKAMAWIWLIEEAAWRDGKKYIGNHVHELKRGQLYASDRYLCEAWGWSRKKVRGFVELMEKNQSLHIKRHTNGTTYTIINYKKYQSNFIDDEEKGPVRDHEGDTKSPIEGPKKKEVKEKNKGKKVDFSPFMETYNCFAERCSWPKLIKLTDARRKTLKVRLKDCESQGIEFQDYLQKAFESKFLREGKGSWRCGFDFLMKEKTFLKTLEGGYDDNGKASIIAEKDEGQNWGGKYQNEEQGELL